MTRYLVIVNQFAGTCGLQGDLELRIRRALAPARVTLLRTASPDEARLEAARARRAGFDGVITVGGDGTHHWVVDALAGGDVPLGVIPLGTANDLAAELGIERDVEAACRVFREGGRARIDLVHATTGPRGASRGKAFATAGGMGLCTDVALGVCEARKRSRAFHWLMRQLGGLIYQLYMVWLLAFGRRLEHAYRLEQEDGTTRDVEAYMALVMNQAFLGKNFQAVPDASNRDGAFDVLLIKKHGWLPRLRLVATVATTLRAGHIGRADVEVVRARRLEVHAARPEAFFADGEHLGTTDRFVFRALPRALPVFVPLDRAEERAPARREAVSSGFGSGSGSGSGLFAA